MKKYLVTGGSGFIGSHLVDALLFQGHQVIVLDDASMGQIKNIYPSYDATVATHIPARENLTFIQDCITNKSIVMDCLNGISGCFHLAARLGMVTCKEDWVGTHLINLTATISLFDAIQKFSHRYGNNIPVVYASSFAVYGDLGDQPFHENLKVAPISSYGADKLGCELHARIAQTTYGVPNVGLRFANVYGPRQRLDSVDSGAIRLFIEKIRRNEPITVFGDGQQTRDFIHVSDIVQHCLFFMTQMKNDAEVFNACSGTAITINKLLQLLQDISQKNIQINYAEKRAGDIMYALGDPTKARNAGIDCQVPLIEGLTELWNLPEAS